MACATRAPLWITLNPPRLHLWTPRRCPNSWVQFSFGGASPFADTVEVAAAYLFYLCRSHPFIDGNKRTAMTAAIVFLRLNGFEPTKDSEAWESLVLEVSASKFDREAATKGLRKLLKG